MAATHVYLVKRLKKRDGQRELCWSLHWKPPTDENANRPARWTARKPNQFRTRIGRTPGVIRKHYDKFDRLAVATKARAVRQTAADAHPTALVFAHQLRAAESGVIDGVQNRSQTATA